MKLTEEQWVRLYDFLGNIKTPYSDPDEGPVEIYLDEDSIRSIIAEVKKIVEEQ